MAEPSAPSAAASPTSPAAGHPGRSPVTWLLALALVVVFDGAITRTSLLWGPTAFEHSGGVRLVFPQTYQVARKIYAPAGDPDLRVALLGNSRVVLAVRERRLDRAFAAVRPDLEIATSNLGIFGSFLGETEMLARHLGALDPDVVVLALGAPDLIREATHPPGEGPMDLLQIGFRDGSVAASGVGEKIDRWLRTVWPLYRFREFAREAILDRLLARPDPGAPPEEFATREELFAHLYGDRADAVAAAFRSWQTQGGLARYARYLETASPGHLVRGKERAQSRDPLTRETPSVVALDALLAGLAAGDPPAILVLMPENPILAEDVDGDFHRPGLSARAAGIARELAASHGIPVVDARDWLPADRFLDFDHPIFELEELERRLAQEILNVRER